ncbi:MAG TPA: sigma-70 family RNA polymerase sigma factor [Xanthobacteraceae bacterium]
MGIGHTQSNTSSTLSGTAASQISEESLIRLIARGDKGALEVLYIRDHVRVYRFVMRLVADESTAEEIVNEVFLEAWRHADKFEGKSRVTTWLLAIARFKALTALRQRSDAQLDDQVAAAIEDPADSPSIAVGKKERSEIVQRCIAKLAPQHREVINLIYYQGNKVEEVARCIGAPINTIKTRMHYARNRMAELLADAGVDGAWVTI